MKAVARVLDVRGDRAQLACEEQPACPACSGGRGCALRWLAPTGAPAIEVPRVTSGGAALIVGQSVTIVVADGELLRSAGRLYLLPLAGLLAGPLLVRWSWDGGEGVAFLAAVAGLAAGWAVARRWIRGRPPLFTVHPAGARE